MPAATAAHRLEEAPMSRFTGTVTITVGWTRRDPATGYSPMSDGYRPGVSQHTIDLDVDLAAAGVLLEADPTWWSTSGLERIAEAVFHATNAGGELGDLTGLAAQVGVGIAATGYRGAEAGHYSLSVGDTVTVGEVTLACAPRGWDRVILAPAI